MKTRKLYIIAALLGTVLASCQKEETIIPNNNPAEGDTWTLTVQVIKSKALELSGIELNGYWKNGEEVAVYFGGEKLGKLTAIVGSPRTKAVLSGDITKPGSLMVDSDLMLLFPGRNDGEWTYVGQDGSAPSETGTLATLFDYSTAMLNVDDIDEGAHTITASVISSFANEQSVYRFGFKVGGAGDAIEVKSFTISSEQGKIVRNRTYSAGDWVSNYGTLSVTSASAPAGNLYYMALRNENTTVADTYSFTVVGSNDALYEGTKTIASGNLGNDKFLSASSINVTQKALAPAPGTISEEIEVL